jgi:hypothetical protein
MMFVKSKPYADPFSDETPGTGVARAAVEQAGVPRGA